MPSGPRGRAALFTAVCVTLSATCHVLLSRTPLPPAALAAVCAGIFAAAYGHTGREHGYGRTAALLVPLELAADTVFTTGQYACYGPLRAVGVDLLCRGAAGGTGPAGPTAPRPGLPAVPPAAAWPLLAAHLAVGLLAAGWLHRGQDALGALLRAAGAGAARPLRTAAAVVRAAVARRHHRRAPRPSAPPRPLPLRRHYVRRRGPPFPAAV
ncbi:MULTISPECIES: hypothetical protein [unclassified Streptomyces]|uniref:hypothetical protein n=1 Tax=unclassified Streptomyces TaxID=2593676 RepID=UPI00340559E9